MSSQTQITEQAKRARTLEEMLAAVPELGKWDTLDALPFLASYDRNAKGWLTIGFSWLMIGLSSLVLMSVVVGGLFMACEFLIPLMRPSVDGLSDGLGGLPLRILMTAIASTLSVLFFLFMGPRRWLVDSLGRLRRRVELRLVLLRAIRQQINRNRDIVDNHWRSAVCKVCLARYERYRVRFAYGRCPGFARCRKCRSDHACYTRVRRIEGWLDHMMGESQEQAGDVLKVNMLRRLPPDSLSLPIDLDEVVVASAEDEDVEMLIFLYREQQPRTDLPKPKHLRCRVTGNSTVSQMARRQLKQNFLLPRATAGGAYISS